MQRLERVIQVDKKVSVRSIWAVPASYAPGSGCGVVLAHGAGAGMDHDFISSFHEALGAAGVLAVKFNFPYREHGRKTPDAPGRLEATYRKVVERLRKDRLAPRFLFAGGKSMGGRIATQLAAQGLDVDGLILLGYPLHPPGRPDRLRKAHFRSIQCPCLFLQGTRDALCRLDLLSEAVKAIPGEVTLRIVEGGDHSFQVLKRSGRTESEVRSEVLRSILEWMDLVGRSE